MSTMHLNSLKSDLTTNSKDQTMSHIYSYQHGKVASKPVKNLRKLLTKNKKSIIAPEKAAKPMRHPDFPSIIIIPKNEHPLETVVKNKTAEPVSNQEIASKRPTPVTQHTQKIPVESDTDISTALSRIFTVNHMTHIDNLSLILSNGLLSHNNPFKQTDISNREVNSRRSAIEPIFHRPIHDYVPFYFNARNAMLYKTQMDYGSAIVILGFDRSLMLHPHKVITDRNASANAMRCSNKETFYESMEWEKISASSWSGDNDLRQIMMAELLIPDHVGIEHLQYIYINDLSIRAQVLMALSNANLHDIQVVIAPKLFF